MSSVAPIVNPPVLLDQTRLTTRERIENLEDVRLNMNIHGVLFNFTTLALVEYVALAAFGHLEFNSKYCLAIIAARITFSVARYHQTHFWKSLRGRSLDEWDGFKGNIFTNTCCDFFRPYLNYIKAW